MTLWWKDGDHSDVEPYTDRGSRKATDLCPTCSQAWEVHGQALVNGEKVVVHPGDNVISSRGSVRVERYDPMEAALKEQRKGKS